MTVSLRVAPRGLMLVALTAMLGLSACGWAKNVTSSKNRVYFEDLYFPARISSTKAARQNFVVTVERAEQGLSGAREAGRYQATRHCIEHYGRSDVIWTHGPDVEDAELQFVSGKLQFEGRCDV